MGEFIANLQTGNRKNNSGIEMPDAGDADLSDGIFFGNFAVFHSSNFGSTEVGLVVSSWACSDNE